MYSITTFYSVRHTACTRCSQAADLLARYCAAKEPPNKSAGAASKPPASSRVGSGDRLERTVRSEVHGGGGGGDPAANSMSPLEKHLMATPPGVVLVIAQSLSYTLGVILSLCEADVSFEGEGRASAVSVLCSPAWWNPAVDEIAERRLAARFPSVRLIKEETDFQCLSSIDAHKADLVCVVASRPEDGGGGGGDGGDFSQGLGDSSGRGQGSDVWALGIAVDVLGLVPESTRVVVRFDDSTSAKQHQVVSAHVRRRTDARAARRRERAAAAGGADEKREEEGEEKEGSLGVAAPSGVERRTTVAAAAPGTPHTDGSPGESARHRGRDASRRWSACMPAEDVDVLSFVDSAEARKEGEGVYFDDARGVVHEGFDDYYATMSGYVSGDVVIGNAAELLLLQVCADGVIRCWLVCTDTHRKLARCGSQTVGASETARCYSGHRFFQKNCRFRLRRETSLLGNLPSCCPVCASCIRDCYHIHPATSPERTFSPWQSMLASDVQSLMSDVLNLVSRVPIEALWPPHRPSKDSATESERKHRARPTTYGEAYRLLLEDRDLLALGLHRPPIGSQGEGPLLSTAKASSDDSDAASYRRCPGGSRYVAINCPSASFAVRDGDCFFVLRRPSEKDGVTAPPAATASVKDEPL